MSSLSDLQAVGSAPDWMNDEGYRTLQGGYLLPGETPRGMYQRLAKACASYYTDSAYWEARFLDVMWKGWLCPASPVLSNMGADRGLPISCISGEAWLNTRLGGVQMQDVKVGDELLTHKGRFRKVLAKTSRISNGDLFQLRVGTRLTPIHITGNHPVLTNLGWVRADALDPKIHYIATNSHIETVECPMTLNMRKYVKYTVQEVDGLLIKESENKRACKRPKNGLVSYYAKVRADVEVDVDLSWALGLWCAEGSITRNPKANPNGARITMGFHEGSTLEKWLDIVKQKFNVHGKVSFSEYTRENFAKGKTTRWGASVNAGPVGEFFETEFGVNCKIKTLPQWLIDLPKPHLHAFLEGLVEGDGNLLNNGTWSVALANPRLLLGVYNICLKLGISVSLQMQAKKSAIGTTKYVYVIRTLSDESIKLSKYNANSGLVVGDLRYCPIIQLTRLEEEVEVFDITVEEDSSFSVAGVLVHNCNSIHSEDSISGIFMKNFELAMLSKNGAGVGIYLGDVRGRGASIKGNGVSEGVIPWSKVFDTTTMSVSQGSTRRGASAIYLPIEHADFAEFLRIRRPTGDVNRQCLNINQGVCITDSWMKDMLAGNQAKRDQWVDILKTRVETGQPYLMFVDAANRQNPECYTGNGLSVKTSNICTEVMLHTDPEHTFVCCLSSLNLLRWDEWKDTDLPQVAARFLDAVLEEYIIKTERVPGLEPSRASAMKGRAIGIGVLGWHSLLQSQMIPFDSFEAMQLNAQIFRTIRTKAEEETKRMAEELGEPLWCKGYGRRNTHLIAIAPTVSNSSISGGFSAGIEPLAANVYAVKSAKGTFLRKNTLLETLLEAKGKNTLEVWRSINEAEGSVHSLPFLSDEEKVVFQTAREINQHAVIKQAVQRQKWVDQGQSINLFFSSNSDPRYIHEVHIAAWEGGLKSLYYFRTSGVLRGDLASRSKEECRACEG